MSIPSNIRPEHVRSALRRIDAEGFPAGRASTRYVLVHDGKDYPPKVVISYANSFANGTDLSHELFSGGDETNRFLSSLGFTIHTRATTDAVSINTWLFQANPDYFDIDDYLRDKTYINWTARQHRDSMNVGDRVFIWRAKGSAKDSVSGIIASGEIVQPPSVRMEDEDALSYWAEASSAKPEPRVSILIDHVAGTRGVVKRDWLTNDPGLSDLRILRLRNETNYLLDHAQATRIEALWARTGRAWNRAESIGGLYAYGETLGHEISRKDGTPVADVAITIGRVVTGVYNKVMNFRSLDPRETDRKGLARTSAMDRSVWAEYFDEASGRLLTERLHRDYSRLWLVDPASSTPIATQRSDLAPDSGPRPSGQGYVSDKWRRRATELRAMEVAEEYFERDGFAVRDVSATCSYDLRCVKGDLVVHVEVKGTAGSGEEIELTIGEVNDARNSDHRTDLIIVSQIDLEGEGSQCRGHGGATHLLRDWTPVSTHLRPIRFRYRVPRG